MQSFFAMIWNVEDARATRYAQGLHQRIERMPDGFERVAWHPGFALYDLSSGRRIHSTLRLNLDDGSAGGAIFGTLFRAGDDNHPAPVKAFTADETTRLCRSQGKALVKDYWGHYVAFLACGETHAVIVDPTASIPCYHAMRDGVALFFSHLERCHFLDMSGFTINEDHVRTLLAYDKIQNGLTGLNEVSELLGGQRLRVSDAGMAIDRIWDPRKVALDVQEPPADAAAAELKATTERIVQAWRQCHSDIVVSLSGGLDSTIVLHALAAGRGETNVSAAHYQLNSGDAPESRYARIACDSAACGLITIDLDPQAGLQTLGAHPPSVRPYRQFLSPDLTARLPDRFHHSGGALFTGQGGDHLFLVSQSPLGFADHVRNHGLSAGTAGALLQSAHLSGKSIWRVLAETRPLLMGRPHVSAMADAVDGRQTLINHHARAQLDLASALPDWVSDPLRLPPAKFDQVSILMHMIQMREPFFTASPIETVHPLISQPLIELCLRLPTYLLSHGGTSRGLVRRAFRGAIPEQIRLRMNKGHASRYFTDRVTAHHDQIVDALMSGELQRRGMILRSDVEAFIRHDDYRMRDSGSLLLAYFAIESWLQTWAAMIGKPSSDS